MQVDANLPWKARRGPLKGRGMQNVHSMCLQANAWPLEKEEQQFWDQTLPTILESAASLPEAIIHAFLESFSVVKMLCCRFGAQVVSHGCLKATMDLCVSLGSRYASQMAHPLQ